MPTLTGTIRRLACAAIFICAGRSAGAVAPGQIDLHLATLDGSAFVRLSDFPDRAILINIWDTECPACVKETAFLNAQARIYPQVQFLGIATGERIASIRFSRQFHVSYPQLQAPHDPSGLLRRLGDPRQGLPFTVMLDAGHRVCATRLGAVDANWMADAVRKGSSR